MGDEDHPGGELRAVGDRTTDERCSKDCERQLEGCEQHFRDIPVHRRRVDARHADVLESADDATVIVRRTRGCSPRTTTQP